MKLKIEANIFLPNVFKEISSLTDKAIVNPNSVEYDERKGIVKIPIQRINILENKYKDNKGKSITNSQKNFLKSIIIIRNVKELKMKFIKELEIKEVTILFGLQIQENYEIYFCSAEETKGDNLLEMIIKINKFDIELLDE
jgi:hypothetical protein